MSIEKNTEKVMRVIHDQGGLKVLTSGTSFKFTAKCRAQVEKLVKKWLDESGMESPSVEIAITTTKGDRRKRLLFFRHEIFVKTCANCWDVYHVARSEFYPNLVSSDSKAELEDHSLRVGYGFSLKNEVRPATYDGQTADYCKLVAHVKDGRFDYIGQSDSVMAK